LKDDKIKNSFSNEKMLGAHPGFRASVSDDSYALK